jgi:hypothetical protein
MPFTVASIVEGHGEVLAVPLLLRGIRPEWLFPRPIRVSRQRIVKQDELEHYVHIARATIAEHRNGGAILLILDADDECPKDFAPRLLDRIVNAAPGVRAGVVLAKRMFESWLIAGRAVADLPVPADPEAIHNPAERIKAVIGRYRKTADQPRLTARIDMDAAKHASRSFRKLLTTIESFDDAA